jgi:hypothetical protein
MSFMWIPPAGANPSWTKPGPVVLRPSENPAVLRRTLVELSMAELESAWSRTSGELSRGVPPGRRWVLVQLRGLILDEVESRSVRRYRRWLRRGGPHVWPSQAELVVLG